MICVSYTRSRIKFGEAISISEQNEKITEFVKGRRMTIDKKYSDRKEEIDTDEGFLEMKEAGINRQYDCVVFWSIMYFGNDPLVGYNLLLHTFIPAGIDFAVVCDNFFSVGHSTEEIEKYLASKYKERRFAHGKNIARIAADKRRNTLYGYEKHGDEFVIDKKVEPIVKEIFKLVLDGKSISDICKHLNDESIECPHMYLRRIAGADTTGAIECWERGQVKKILTDTRYKGNRKISKNGATSEKSIEPYITSEEYDKIQSNFKHHEIKNRNENPFLKMIFDMDTHVRLYIGDYLNNGGNYYYMSKRTPEYGQYKKKVIEVQTVIDEVTELINQEVNLAKHVIVCLNSASGQAEISIRKEKTMAELKDKLGVLLNEVHTNIKADSELVHFESIEKLDMDFNKMITQRIDLNLSYSSMNPWIKMYSELGRVDNLSLNFCKKYVGEILIDKFEKVVFVPKHNEWKQQLPAYWLED